jgi:hypothetical protein
MLVGPDGNPLAPVVGAPKLEELPPLQPEDMGMIAEPLRQAMAGGVHMMSPCTVEFGMVARLVATVLQLHASEEGAVLRNPDAPNRDPDSEVL